MLYIYSECEVIEMTIVVSLQSDIPAYEQIKTQIKAQILAGELTADEPLTSMRQLARDLRVSVITTTRAYGDLEAEGLIYTVQGRGCFVKGNAELIREQYLRSIEDSLEKAVDKGKAVGLSLSELQNKLEEKYNEQQCN
jgi:GntR family transcriptional regulator